MKALYVLFGCILVMVSSFSFAVAAPPTSLTGGFYPTGPATVYETRQAGGNTFIHQSFTYILYGDLNGTVVTDEQIVIHSDGSINLHSIHHFQGTLIMDGESVSGTFDLNVTAKNNGETFTGQWTLIRGTAGFAEFHVQGDLQGDAATGVGTYSGQYHFSPAS